MSKEFYDKPILDYIKNANASANPDLIRLAMKMATGAGKTTVMAMLIAWHVANALTRRGFCDRRENKPDFHIRKTYA